MMSPWIKCYPHISSPFVQDLLLTIFDYIYYSRALFGVNHLSVIGIQYYTNSTVLDLLRNAAGRYITPAFLMEDNNQSSSAPSMSLRTGTSRGSGTRKPLYGYCCAIFLFQPKREGCIINWATVWSKNGEFKAIDWFLGCQKDRSAGRQVSLSCQTPFPVDEHSNES